MTDRHPAAQLGQQIAVDRLPVVAWSRSPVLAAATRDPLLRRKRRRDQRAFEQTRLETGSDLVNRPSAQQGIDFLEGDVGAAKGSQPGIGGRRRLARIGVQGKARPVRSVRNRIPQHRHGPGQADQRRRGIERAGQVVGDDPDDGHAAADAIRDPLTDRRSGLRRRLRDMVTAWLSSRKRIEEPRRQVSASKTASGANHLECARSRLRSCVRAQTAVHQRQGREGMSRHDVAEARRAS